MGQDDGKVRIGVKNKVYVLAFAECFCLFAVTERTSKKRTI